MQHKIINAFCVDALMEEIELSITKRFKPTLAFIYLSIEYDIEYLIKKLKKYSFIVVGSTTHGEVYADERLGAKSKEQSITCMLTNLDKSAFKIKLKKMKDESYVHYGKRVGKWASKQFNHAALLTITSGLEFDNESYINGLQKEIKLFFGAVAADDGHFKQTYVFSNKKILSKGVLALAIDRDKIEMLMGCGLGWKGIGIQYVVTKAKKNIVYTIDDKPALEFYKEYLQIDSSDMPMMGIDYPLEVLLQSGELIYRASIQINEDGSLLFAGHIPKGSKVRISTPVGIDVIDYVKNSILDSLSDKQEFKSDLTLVFPCVAHKNLLGKHVVKEIEMAYNQTGKAPLIGFYAYGEIASEPKGNALHNETFVTVQLREKQ